MELRRMTLAEADILFALRLRALEQSPNAFFITLGEEKAEGDAHFKKILSGGDASAIFGSLADGKAVGMIGVYRGARKKERHKAYVWGVFVEPPHRGQGLAGRLLDLAIAHARGVGVSAIYLSVESGSVAAKRLYESRGFKRWGTEPRAMKTEGRCFDEDHMVLLSG